MKTLCSRRLLSEAINDKSTSPVDGLFQQHSFKQNIRFQK